MGLSPNIQERLEKAGLNEPYYQPNKEISEQLGGIVIAMLIGPAGIGKTRVIEDVAAMNEDFGALSVFSTRTPRPDDTPGMFDLHPHTDEGVSELLDRIERGEPVSYTIHPTQGTIYGQMLSDYKSRVNLLATLSGSVDQIQRMPYKETHALGLSAEPSEWADRFNDRYPEMGEARTKRLGEAVISLSWLLGEDHSKPISWIINEEGNSALAANAIINKINNDQPTDTDLATFYAKGMLKWAQETIDKEK